MRETTFTVTMVRSLKGGEIVSTLEHTVKAVSTAQAQRKAEHDLPGWKAKVRV